MSVFLLARVFECGNFHSTGISRFIAKPVPVPLQGSRLNRFFHVACSYSGVVPKTSLYARIATLSLLTRCCLGPRRLENPLSCNANFRMACSLGQNGRQSPKLSRSRGYVSDSGHTPFTSSTLAATQRYRAAGSTLPGKASIAFYGIRFLFDNGSEPG